MEDEALKMRMKMKMEIHMEKVPVVQSYCSPHTCALAGGGTLLVDPDTSVGYSGMQVGVLNDPGLLSNSLH